jgi:hypothetical protein
MQDNYRKEQEHIPSISFTNMLALIFRGVSQFLKDFLFFVHRYFVLLLLFVIAGSAYGYINFKVSPAYYKLSTVVRHTELTSATFGRMVTSLNDLATSGSTRRMADALKLPESMAGQVRSINAYSIEKFDLQKDTSSEKERTLLIEVTVRDPGIADTLQNALVGYFNGNDYLSGLKRDEITLYEERLQFLDAEIRRMDTLMDAYNHFLSQPRSAAVYNNAFDPSLLYKQADLYSSERQRIREWLLQSRQAMVTIDGFKPTQTPSSISMRNSVILYILIFFFVGCGIAGLIDVLKSAPGKK